tara:strand:+ start:110 stop:367 length:258 start_codon:yes stop_codon:yes gene_type:complete
MTEYTILLSFYCKSGLPCPSWDILEKFTGTEKEAIEHAKELRDNAEEGLEGYTKEIAYGGYSWDLIWYEDDLKMYMDESGEVDFW